MGLEREWYHNHNNDATDARNHHYRYPLIQYLRRRGQPTILFIGEAVREARYFLERSDWTLRLHGKEQPVRLGTMHAEQFELRDTGNQFREYQLSNWLALNQHNYERYESLDRLSDRIALLEKVLSGQLLALASGIGVTLEQRFDLFLTDLDRPRVVPYRDRKMMSFRARFRVNLQLPVGFGVGKGVSIGHGRLYPYEELEATKPEEV